MTKLKHTGLLEGGAITEEVLLAYAAGRLGHAERAEVDKLISDDPFAQEALEGMLKSSSPAEIHTVITSINTQLREKTGIRERNKKGIEIHWANYAYAALVLGVLVGVAFVMIQIFSNNNKKQMARATESAPVIEDKRKESTKADTAKLIAADAQKDSAASKVNGALAATNTTTGGTIAYGDNGPVTTATNTVSTESANRPTQAAVAEKSAEQLESTPSAGAVSQTASSSNAEVAVQLGLARTYFDAGNYSSAEKKYNEILSTQPDNGEAVYFGGVCNFINGTNGLGESNFDRLLKAGIYTDGAKWYKALILLKKGKKEEAKPILKDLSVTGGYFKDRAAKQYSDTY